MGNLLLWSPCDMISEDPHFPGFDFDQHVPGECSDFGQK